ncbi:diguanylate cyclase (GGDEF) domain-containing protein [Marinitoga hydrogenitolerans DSM 16785]|uniref:Diguanylate cyclase (GGDEF) domain-containing protein n=1 Tax=Marinitoga hydrogenitolerans (strain DSM 16785 / JCM 12826 / AT1271) TaxID=1122195 RepID=A0A1M4S8A1_MARH1|nr:GGDEF domain-containing protein [Marinitoga hydrogenitolerans]SHE28429.1 diguanylate cyclase (GGDEF) domain-containing protein [Marinitoga hydrogenitolerans DSM 16785]
MEKFQVFFRETLFGKEYLKIINDRTFRVRVTESSVFHYKSYLEILKSLEPLNEFGLMLPEKIEYDNEEYRIFTEYWNEIPITEIDIDEEKYYNILYTVYDLTDRVTHSTNIIIPYIYLEDIFIDETNNVTLMPSVFIPRKSDNIIINKKKSEEGVIELLINFSTTVYNLMSEKTELVKEFVKTLKNNSFECVHDLYVFLLKTFNYRLKKNKIRIPHFINRESERDRILEVLGKKHIYIYGPQRIGKTRLIDFMEFKFKELNYNIIRARNVKDIFSGDIKVPESMNIFYFLNFIELLRQGKKDFKLIMIVDDYQDINIKFKNFIEDIINKNFDFPFSLVLMSHVAPTVEFENIEYIELKPFNLKKTETLLKIILSSDFLKKYPEIVDIIYNLSDGYPGNIYQTIKDLNMLEIIKIENGKYVFYPEKLKVKKIIDLAEEKIDNIPDKIKQDLKYLSTLGFKFTVNEIKDLETYFKTSFDNTIIYALERDILLKEGNEYRFFNLIYQDLFHNSLSIKEQVNIHMYLCKKSISLEKKIFHLKNARKIKSTIALIIKEMRKSIFEWKNLNFIDYGFNEIKNITDDIPLSTIAIYLSKKYFFNEFSDDLKEYIEKIKNSKVYEYIAYLFLKYSDEDKLNKKLLEWINDKETTDYKKVLYIYYYLNLNFSKLEKEEVYDYYFMVEKTFLKHRNLHKFKTIKGMLLNMLGIKMETELPELAVKYYNDALSISLEVRYKRLTQIVYANLAILYESLNSNLSEYYNRKVLEISKEIGDYQTYNRILINIANNKLYKGEIKEFFDLINKAERYSKINKDFNSYIFANDIKNYYFLYAKDYANLESNLRKITEYSKNKPFLKDSIEGIKDNIHILKALIEKDRPFFSNRKYKDKVVKNEFFQNFYNIIFENDEKIVYDAWLFFKNNPVIYLKEEMVSAAAEKISHYSFSEEFEKWVLELIKEFKNKKLSIALLYEGLGYFYTTKKEKFKALKFLRKAQKTYDDLMMKNRFEEINKFLMKEFRLPMFIYEEIYSMEYNIEKYNYNNLISKIKSYEKINNLIIELLKSDSPKYLVEKIGEFLRDKYPINEILIRIITKDYEVEYNFNFKNEKDLKNDQFFIKPLKLSYISDYKDYKYYIYLSNSNIELSQKDAVDILDNIIIIEDVLYSILDKITHYEHSILDPLTNAYTRRYMENKLKELHGLYERYKFDFSIMLIDLDDFKKVNDKYGHQKGDEVLVELVKSLKKHLRDFDMVCRYGGEEFLLILPNTSLEDAEKIAKRLLKDINKDLLEKTKLNITCSIGVSSISEIIKEPRLKLLIENADKALYRAKNNGKNQVEVI